MLLIPSATSVNLIFGTFPLASARLMHKIFSIFLWASLKASQLATTPFRHNLEFYCTSSILFQDESGCLHEILIKFNLFV